VVRQNITAGNTWENKAAYFMTAKKQKQRGRSQYPNILFKVTPPIA
jgi:hypothetical protein